MPSQSSPCSLTTAISRVQRLCQQAQVNGQIYCAGLESGPRTLESSPFIQQVICDAIVWIDNHLFDELTIAAVAGRSGYTRWYFQRKFHDMTGMTVIGYIKCRRLEHAVDDLLQGNKSLNDIACRFGFSGGHQLSRTIRKYMGMTVTELRVKHG